MKGGNKPSREELKKLAKESTGALSGTVEFSSEIAISLNFTAEHAENAEAPENLCNGWDGLKTLRTRRSPR